ncbi:hypothetical protein BpHYR1_042865 [Brachionus plicatilis]|uniref:Uncharacterized protein n=1 Tax=Brachionus plicatilis TaxID=10195 RepID=A0A3M7PUZ6_BRAPC|nr:hypothetical protein BpHYR1_042865 [Brachionus plicatilis]
MKLIFFDIKHHFKKYCSFKTNSNFHFFHCGGLTTGFIMKLEIFFINAPNESNSYHRIIDKAVVPIGVNPRDKNVMPAVRHGIFTAGPYQNLQKTDTTVMPIDIKTRPIMTNQVPFLIFTFPQYPVALVPVIDYENWLLLALEFGQDFVLNPHNIHFRAHIRDLNTNKIFKTRDYEYKIGLQSILLNNLEKFNFYSNIIRVLIVLCYVKGQKKEVLKKEDKMNQMNYFENVLFKSDLFISHITTMTSYDLHQNFYPYLLHLDQLKEFFHNLVTLTDHKDQD